MFLEDMAGMMSMNTHLKGLLGFSGDLDIGFLIIVEIWHDVQNGSGYTLISISCQKCAVYPVSSDIVYLCPDLWCNNHRESFVLEICFCDFEF